MNGYMIMKQRLSASESTIEGKAFAQKMDEVCSELLKQGDLSVESVASRLCITPSMLRNHTRRLIDVCPSQIIMYVRLRQAIAMLSTYPRPHLADIAVECGFFDKAHFTKSFTRYLGCTPSKFVNQPVENES